MKKTAFRGPSFCHLSLGLLPFPFVCDIDLGIVLSQMREEETSRALLRSQTDVSCDEQKTFFVPYAHSTSTSTSTFKKKKKTLSSANERTFLAWLSMAVSLGGVSTALVGFTAEEKPDSASKHPGVLRRKTVDLISVLLLPVSIAMIGYALFIFLCRSRSIRTKQVGFFTDWLGPAVLAGVLLLVLLTITVAAFASVIAG